MQWLREILKWWRKLSKTDRILLAGLIILFLLVHGLALTRLPVFADEAIYIRWAQLIMDEPLRYLFFPLNDGKTPLMVWLFVPFQYLVKNPLAAVRIESVLAGLAQMAITGLIVKKLGGQKTAVISGVVLAAVLPFFYFYAQMALMDTLLTLWLSCALWAVINLGLGKTWRIQILWTILISLFLGLALWTKLPALLFIPALAVFLLSKPELNLAARFRSGLLLIAAIVMGLSFFFLLKFHPAFSQLFSRGGDFLFPFTALFTLELWWRLPGTLWLLIKELSVMVTIPVLLAPLVGLLTRKRVFHLRFLLAWLAFCLPIVFLGKVVYLRYYLPSTIFLLISASFLLESFFLKLKTATLVKQIMVAVVIIQVMVMTLVPSLQFIAMSIFDPNQLALPRSEFEQYLGDWSSGHGVKETIDMLALVSQTNKVAVATEGFFGTLPDGMLLYLHNMVVTNIWVEGIGQPVDDIPDIFWNNAQSLGATSYWLVVNSHRMKITDPDIKLIAEFCRPKNTPCLQVWDIATLKPEFEK